MPTATDLLIQIGIGSVPLGVAYLAYRSATDANKRNAAMEDRKVDQAAYDRAQTIYEKGMQQLERQLERAQRQISGLEESVLVLRSQLIQAGIPPDPSTLTVHINTTRKDDQ